MVTVAEYAAAWLARMHPPLVKRRTRENYARMLRLHIVPLLGPTPLVALSRKCMRAAFDERLRQGYGLGTVRLMVAVLRAMLSAAVEDELLPGNPAFGIGRVIARRHRQTHEVRALSDAQVEDFLAAADRLDSARKPLFLCLFESGLRLGEALGLQRAAVDFEALELDVVRQWALHREETPKDHRTRIVDMSRRLAACLAGHLVGHTSHWVFVGPHGEPWEASGIAQSMKRLLVAAGLPRHFSPKDARHTFASRLLARGVSPAYVQQQLGHGSIQLTVDTYGRWLRIARPAALDRRPAQSSVPVRWNPRGASATASRMRVAGRPRNEEFEG